jgi:dihydroorotate dehydrogenase (NAD+) catalytic subunit
LRIRGRTSGGSRSSGSVDTSTRVGSVELTAAVMTASGTSGHGDELGAFMDLSKLGAVVVKSMMANPWPGNPAPRVHPTSAGMINSVGLQGAGIPTWRREELPDLLATGATVVASIWGRHVEDYIAASEALADVDDRVVAVEVNLSCPNLDGGSHLFAHDPVTAAEVITATEACGRPRWAKLSANTDRVVEVAAAVSEAGAEAVTLINTLKAMVIDPATARPVLGSGVSGGGLSGAAIHPVAVRTVFDVRSALPDLPIVGVGGVGTALDAVEMLMAGADAVQVGTASFAEPRSADMVRAGLEHWCQRNGVEAVTDLKGRAHG